MGSPTVQYTQEQRYFPPHLQLTPKQAKFVLNLAKDPERNHTQAAIKAGYKPKNANITAAQNLAKPYVAEALAHAIRKIERTMLTPEQIVEEWANIALANPKDFYDEDGQLLPVHKLPAHIASAVDKIRSDGSADYYKLSNKTNALESLTKMLGLYAKDNAQKVAEPDQTVVFVDGDMQGLFDKITKRDQEVIDVTPDTQPHEDGGTSDGT